MKEDFDRLQKQLKQRDEKHKNVQANVQNSLEEKLYKISVLNKRNHSTLEKFKKQQRRIEVKSVKEYRKDLLELTEKVKRDSAIDNFEQEERRK